MRKQNGQGVFVFPNPKTGKPYLELNRSFKGVCKRAGIQDLRFHDLRHTFASRLVEKGIDLITVKDLLGHSSVTITERYTHSFQDQKKKAVETLSKKPEETDKKRANLLHICDMEKNQEKTMPVIRFISIN